MALRCFFSMEVIWPVRPGGGIFSNVNAGMPSPLFVELEHSRHFPVQVECEERCNRPDATRTFQA